MDGEGFVVDIHGLFVEVVATLRDTRMIGLLRGRGAIVAFSECAAHNGSNEGAAWIERRGSKRGCNGIGERGRVDMSGHTCRVVVEMLAPSVVALEVLPTWAFALEPGIARS